MHVDGASQGGTVTLARFDALRHAIVTLRIHRGVGLGLLLESTDPTAYTVA